MLARPPRERPAALGLGPLVAVMYFIVSGGPFGLEGLVGSVGPGLALLLLVTTPLVYSVPEALLVGELASTLPLEGGYYQWVKRAFGPCWGFWGGWLSWASSLLDMAIYPVLLLQYLRFFLPELGRLESWIATALAEGASGRKMPPGAVELNNSWGKPGYGGPQPPQGTGDHPYLVTIYA